MIPSVIILTFNSERSIFPTLRQALEISDDVVIVDSFSSDTTVDIAKALGVRVIKHSFENYSQQRNWTIDTVPLRYQWQLHLDADEWMDDKLVRTIQQLPETPNCNGFLIARYVKFLGKVLKHGAMSPTWHLRLFKAGAARCENRRYDQHFYLQSGHSKTLPGHLIDDNQMPLSEWTARHNRWSDAEAEELIDQHPAKDIIPRFFGNPIERKRYWKLNYSKCPLFVRAFTLFAYRYFLRLGFLDGKEGLVFWILQSFWFRFLTDAKLFERRKLIVPSVPTHTIENIVSTLGQK